MSESSDTQYDVIIIGGACAGLAAGTYAGRRAMKTLIITKDIGDGAMKGAQHGL